MLCSHGVVLRKRLAGQGQVVTQAHTYPRKQQQPTLLHLDIQLDGFDSHPLFPTSLPDLVQG